MVPLFIISGRYDVISKKFKKILISRFSVSECFFQILNVLLVISSENAAKWCVTWPFVAYDLQNTQFDHSLRFLSELPVRRSVGHKNYIFEISAKNASIWGITWSIYLWFYLIHIMTVRDEKMFLAESRDLSTDNRKSGIERLINFTVSDKRPKNMKSTHKLSYQTVRKIFDLMEISWLLIEFCGNEWIERLA